MFMLKNFCAAEPNCYVPVTYGPKRYCIVNNMIAVTNETDCTSPDKSIMKSTNCEIETESLAKNAFDFWSQKS